MKNELTVQGQRLSIQAPANIRQHLAEKAGMTLEEGESKKQLVERIIAEGGTKEEIKAWSKELDVARQGYYTASALANGQLAADPTLRKAVRINVNKQGVCIGATTTYRRERSASASKDAIIASLTAQIAAMSAKQITA